jgi:tRNA-splicing ligase RtcB
MAEPAVILRGKESEENAHTLCSTVHGAGRVMSRRAAKGDPKKGISGRVSPKAMQRAIEDARVVLKGGDVDESMHVYKRLPEVLAHHADSIEIVHTLTPIGVAMAGADVFDPFKD